jgi:hypothetical protein
MVGGIAPWTEARLRAETCRNKKLVQLWLCWQSEQREQPPGALSKPSSETDVDAEHRRRVHSGSDGARCSLSKHRF